MLFFATYLYTVLQLAYDYSLFIGGKKRAVIDDVKPLAETALKEARV